MPWVLDWYNFSYCSKIRVIGVRCCKNRKPSMFIKVFSLNLILEMEPMTILQINKIFLLETLTLSVQNISITWGKTKLTEVPQLSIKFSNKIWFNFFFAQSVIIVIVPLRDSTLQTDTFRFYSVSWNSTMELSVAIIKSVQMSIIIKKLDMPKIPTNQLV